MQAGQMDRAEFTSIIEGIQGKQSQLLKHRGDAYNSGENEDVLQNFNDVSVICKTLGMDISPADVAFVMYMVKVVRERMDKDTYPSEDTSKYDSIVDGMNYFMFYVACQRAQVDNNEEVENE